MLNRIGVSWMALAVAAFEFESVQLSRASSGNVQNTAERLQAPISTCANGKGRAGYVKWSGSQVIKSSWPNVRGYS